MMKRARVSMIIVHFVMHFKIFRLGCSGLVGSQNRDRYRLLTYFKRSLCVLWFMARVSKLCAGNNPLPRIKMGKVQSLDILLKLCLKWNKRKLGAYLASVGVSWGVTPVSRTIRALLSTQKMRLGGVVAEIDSGTNLFRVAKVANGAKEEGTENFDHVTAL